MADVKMCDRCGKLIKLTGPVDDFGRTPDILTRKYWLSIKYDETKTRENYTRIDLCQKCYDKLVLFMEKEKKNAQND